MFVLMSKLSAEENLFVLILLGLAVFFFPIYAGMVLLGSLGYDCFVLNKKLTKFFAKFNQSKATKAAQVVDAVEVKDETAVTEFVDTKAVVTPEIKIESCYTEITVNGKVVALYLPPGQKQVKRFLKVGKSYQEVEAFTGSLEDAVVDTKVMFKLNPPKPTKSTRSKAAKAAQVVEVIEGEAKTVETAAVVMSSVQAETFTLPETRIEAESSEVGAATATEGYLIEFQESYGKHNSPMCKIKVKGGMPDQYFGVDLGRAMAESNAKPGDFIRLIKTVKKTGENRTKNLFHIEKLN